MKYDLTMYDKFDFFVEVDGRAFDASALEDNVKEDFAWSFIGKNVFVFFMSEQDAINCKLLMG